MNDVSVIVTRLKRLDGYQFHVDFDVDDMPSLIIDEPKPLGQGSGPNPPRLLSAAVASCLSSSLLYCLNKAHVRVTNLETTAETTITRKEEGRSRVTHIDVQMHLEVDDADQGRVPRCLELFEDYCTVTPSVRAGIAVNIKIA